MGIYGWGVKKASNSVRWVRYQWEGEKEVFIMECGLLINQDEEWE